MTETAEQIRARLETVKAVRQLPHVVVGPDGEQVGEPFPNYSGALLDALYRNGMAGKPLYDVKPAT